MDFSNESGLELSEPFLKFNKEILTINDINNLILKHPLLFRKQDILKSEFPLHFKYAIVDLIRDEQINKVAYLNDYDKHTDVIKEYDLFKDATLSTLHVKSLLERNNITMDMFNENHNDMLDDIFNQYLPLKIWFISFVGPIFEIKKWDPTNEINQIFKGKY